MKWYKPDNLTSTSPGAVDRNGTDSEADLLTAHPAETLRIPVQHLLVIHNRPQWTIEIFCNTCMSSWPIHHVPHHVHQTDVWWLYDISCRTRLFYNYDKLIHIRVSFLMLAVTSASGIQFKRWQTNTCLYFTGYIWSRASPVNDKTWNLVKSRSREIEF